MGRGETVPYRSTTDVRQLIVHTAGRLEPLQVTRSRSILSFIGRVRQSTVRFRQMGMHWRSPRRTGRSPAQYSFRRLLSLPSSGRRPNFSYSLTLV